jgi:hypothetical protein
LDFFSRAGLEELFKPENLTLGVHVGCAPIEIGDAESNNTLRTTVVLTSNASAAIANEDVKAFMQSLQDARDDENLVGRSFFDQTEGFIRQLNASQSGFTAISLRSADVGILSGVQEITVRNFGVKGSLEDGDSSESDGDSNDNGSDNEEFDRLLIPQNKYGLTRTCG